MSEEDGSAGRPGRVIRVAHNIIFRPKLILPMVIRHFDYCVARSYLKAIVCEEVMRDQA